MILIFFIQNIKHYKVGVLNVQRCKNLSGDTLLIVPKERVGKNFSSLYYFMKEASDTQQRMFWKQVALEARNQLKHHPNIYISTEGTGVAYLHVRICTYPKYYGNSKLRKIIKS